MRSWLLKLSIASMTFAVLVAIGCVNLSRKNPPKRVNGAASQSSLGNKCEFKLAANLLSREDEAIANRPETVDENDPIWRWLKSQIALYQARPGFERNSLVLPLEGDHTYRMELYELDETHRGYLNDFFRKEKLPQLRQDQCYVRVGVFLDNWLCPNWGGVVDVDQLRLVHFNGSGP